ncbi:MAG: hydroxylamine oxidoreductase [Candidatus Scalindua sp.]|nr:hydroxylamine oxidoreductase [Candidatus Scalindua sp.]
MQKFTLKTTSKRVIAALIGINCCFIFSNLTVFAEDKLLAVQEKTEKDKPLPIQPPTIQEKASKIFGEAVGDDNNGEVYTWGLTARYTGPEKLIPGEGKFKNLFNFLQAVRWYDPRHYYQSTDKVTGEFTGEQCIMCHRVQTPGIVNDWERSGHSKPAKTASMELYMKVTCDKCHGKDHTKLRMPDYNVCAECHSLEVDQHKSGGPGSHIHSFHLQVEEQSMQINTPAEELYGCAQCHGIAENRCDGCHTRHRFSAVEARKPETCGICHLGLEHYDYEVWLDSYHGRIYQAEGNEWNWNRSLKDWAKPVYEGQLPAPRTPTCAFCHMPEGNHNILEASTEFTYMGASQVDRGAPKHEKKRNAWIKVCNNCHSPNFARDQLNAMDDIVNLNFAKVREAYNIIIDLYNEGVLDPMPDGLAPDWKGHNIFSLLPEGETRIYNVSNIERLFFEMATYQITNVYKAAAHSSMENTSYSRGGAIPMNRKLIAIKAEASRLKRLALLEKAQGIKHVPFKFWSQGEYTDLLKGKNRKEGDVLPKSECLHNDKVDCLAD